MKQLRIFALLVVAVITFSSCEEKDEKPSKTGLLTGKKWVMVAETVSPGIVLIDGTTIVDTFEQFYDDCEKDDILRFNANGTFLDDIGATRCTDEDKSVTGTWAFNTDETAIAISAGGNNDDISIVELTKNTLKVKFSGRIYEDGALHTFTRTFNAK